MTVQEKLKAEIDQLDEQYLDLLYKIVRQFPHDSGKRQNAESEQEISGSGALNVDNSHDHQQKKPGTHASFLLSTAGMFDSGETDTSERVSEIVEDFVAQKHDQGTL